MERWGFIAGVAATAGFGRASPFLSFQSDKARAVPRLPVVGSSILRKGKIFSVC